MLQVCVEPNGWGDARPVDIARLLTDAASHINRELRNPVVGTINVLSAPATDHTPRTLVQYSRPGSYSVQLTATERCWSQYAFQFSHEFCHVMIDPHRSEGGSGANQWLDEAVCEVASMFVLRRMAKRWAVDPPYPNWSSYAVSITEYVNERMDKPEHTMPSGVSLHEWFLSNEETLRRDPHQRDKNAVVAYNWLPIFEIYPALWNAARCLPGMEYRRGCWKVSSRPPDP